LIDLYVAGLAFALVMESAMLKPIASVELSQIDEFGCSLT
jgi:hypothetical protein